MVSTSAKRFGELLRKHRSASSPITPLANFTFFLGAGFSKSWSTKYPTGSELFQVPSHERHRLHYVERSAHFSAVCPIDDLDMNHIKDLVYRLDMNAKYPAIRSRYVDPENVRLAKAELSGFLCRRLQSLVDSDWHWFDPEAQKFTAEMYTADQKLIRSLFREMFPLVDGSQGYLQGARFNFMSTNYDWLVESVVDSVCSSDDSSLIYLYRGVTPREICGIPNDTYAHQHDLVFNLLKLNGGAEVFRTTTGYHFDYRLRTADMYAQEPPVLILPSREQDYADEYFSELFPKAVRLLHESKVLVLVGYSLPLEDALLRFVIRQFCEDEADAFKKELFYVDMASEDEQQVRLQSVFPFAGTTLKTHTFAGGFATWAGEVVSQL